MKDTHNECPKCGSVELSKGVQAGYANVFLEKKLFHLGSEIIHLFCTDCGYIMESYVKKPQKFKQ